MKEGIEEIWKGNGDLFDWLRHNGYWKPYERIFDLHHEGSFEERDKLIRICRKEFDRIEK